LRDLLRVKVEPERLARLLELVAKVQAGEQAAAQRVGIRDDLRRAWSILKLNRTGLAWEERRLVLLDSLRTLHGDRSFDRSFEVPEYLDHAAQLSSSGFGVVLFGHTHLAKQVRLESGATYINTGTWADLMKLPQALFASNQERALAELDRFIDALRENEFRQYLHFEPTFAHLIIDKSGTATAAQLHSGGASTLASL
jgi:hypothetical protein